MNSTAALALPALLLGCSSDDSRYCTDGSTCWASRDEIVAVAKLCGVDDFEPYEAGAAWAAYVPDSIPDHQRKEQCIYDTFKRRGLLMTR